MEVPAAGHKNEFLSGDGAKKLKIKLRDRELAHHRFPVLVEVELNAPQQELVLREAFVVRSGV